MIGHWGSGTGDIRALALAAGDGAAAYVDVTELLPADENALAAWLADPVRHKAMHDAKGPLLAIWARGWELAGLTSDTQLAAYLVRPDQRTFDLADLTIRYLKRELKVDAGPTCSTPPTPTSWPSTSATTTPAPSWRPRRRWCGPGR